MMMMMTMISCWLEAKRMTTRTVKETLVHGDGEVGKL
jgi:hypothetical protein